jgi:transposase
MRQKSGPVKEPAEKVVRDIRRATRRQFSAEEKIRIVFEGLRGEHGIAELCRREGIVQNLYYRGRKIFLRPVKSGSLAIRRGPQPRTRSRTFAAKRAVADADGRVSLALATISAGLCSGQLVP